MESSTKQEALLNERKSDATSDETLSEIEDNEKDSAANPVAEKPGPSPDGPVHEPVETNDVAPL